MISNELDGDVIKQFQLQRRSHAKVPRFVALMVMSAVTGIVLVSCAGRPSSVIQPASGDQFATGKRLYDQHCASCHGLRGEGQYPAAPYKADEAGLLGAPPHDSTGHTWHHPDQVLFDITKNGLIIKGFHPMPPFADKLADDEIRAVLAYIKTWWKPDQLQRQASVSARYTPPAP
jgi:mono/diheme cytochrome c family protein